jgi:hypothetical protein
MNPNRSSVREGRHVLAIKVTAGTPLPPHRVLESTRDFSDRRADEWPNVKAKHLEVHEIGENFADVPEGTWIAGLFWERNRYEWTQPGSVKATVIDSNIFQPGSTWELQATARDGGSEVELVLNRSFRSGPKGRIASTVHHTVGKWVWGAFLRSALAAIEKQTASTSLTPDRTGATLSSERRFTSTNTRRRQRKVLTTGLAHAAHTGSP